jgi:hypothetical protein
MAERGLSRFEKVGAAGRARVVVSVSAIVRHFESLPDPRHPRSRRLLLGDVITLAVCGLIASCDLLNRPHRQHQTTDSGHGRADERYL